MKSTQEPTYNMHVVRQFTLATIVWGVLGMSMGVFIAAQLVWPVLNFDTAWTIGHVHASALGWVAMISIGSLYYMIPRLWNPAAMYSTALISLHFWLATAGTVLYIASMWVNGITQGLMWRAINDDGTLSYSFVEALSASHFGYVVRLIGGGLFASGMLLLALNCWLTLRASQPATTPVTEVRHA
ncbi:MAG: cbb3-type cytochrome c oxidase subunit I [Thiopseudomonas sp.]|nr:cbb3-type cytochrome c oxidase subunit I [Thiopseudomonas sp.]